MCPKGWKIQTQHIRQVFNCNVWVFGMELFAKGNGVIWWNRSFQVKLKDSSFYKIH